MLSNFLTLECSVLLNSARTPPFNTQRALLGILKFQNYRILVPRSRLTSYFNTRETTDTTGICILFSCGSRPANEVFGVALFPSSVKHQGIVFPVLVNRRAKRCCLYYANAPATFRRKFFNCTILYGPNRVATFNPCEVCLVGIHPNPGPTCWSDSLRALYLNARSLKAIVKSVDDAKKFCKITLLQRLVYGGDFDVVLITETWLNAAIFDTEILPGYTIYRRDRGERAGGVLVAIKRDIQSARRNDLERESTELVVVELRNGHDKPVLLYCFYHPDIAPEPLTQLNSSLQENGESSCLILGGDFNLPELDWSEDMSVPINNGGRADHNVFCDLMGDNFLQQFISGPTHISGNKLDLLLSNWPEVIENVSTFHPRDGRFPSDHYVITFTIKLRFKRSKGSTRQVFDFKNGNLDALRESLSRTPFQIAASEDIDEYWSNWKDLFLSAVKDHVPTKTVRDTNSPPWIDGEVRHLIRKKYTALKKYRQHKTEERKQKLRALSQNLKYVIRCKHHQYLAKIEMSFKDNPKIFWSYHKAFLGGRSGANSVISYNGVAAEKPE